MRPFFSFFGSKWRVALHYPQPTYNTIIEPFAGSAGYSLRYPEWQIKLFDADPVICELWGYLIHVSPAEIRRLPVQFDHIDDLNLCQESKSLIGFWLNKGTTVPSKSASKWMREYQSCQPGTYWGEKIKERIALQVPLIRHWTIAHASYHTIPDQFATWFIDPPYEVAGKAYKFHDIGYPALGDWCQSRTGQVIVCENAGAAWLPFTPFRTIKGLEGKRGGKKSVEVIWANAECPALPLAAVPVGRDPLSQTGGLSL
jgi:hypothetical protein